LYLPSKAGKKKDPGQEGGTEVIPKSKPKALRPEKKSDQHLNKKKKKKGKKKGQGFLQKNEPEEGQRGAIPGTQIQEMSHESRTSIGEAVKESRGLYFSRKTRT